MGEDPIREEIGANNLTLDAPQPSPIIGRKPTRPFEARMKELLAHQVLLNAALDLDKNETLIAPPAEDDIGLVGRISPAVYVSHNPQSSCARLLSSEAWLLERTKFSRRLVSRHGYLISQLSRGYLFDIAGRRFDAN
jgi:hypothetical protein